MTTRSDAADYNKFLDHMADADELCPTDEEFKLLHKFLAFRNDITVEEFEKVLAEEHLT